MLKNPLKPTKSLSAQYYNIAQHSQIPYKRSLKQQKRLKKSNKDYCICSQKIFCRTAKQETMPIFHSFTHKKVAKNKTSKHILNLVQKSNKHKRCLSSNRCNIEHSFGTNFGRSALLNLLHQFKLKNHLAKALLTFKLPATLNTVEDYLLGRVLVRSCVPSFVVHTTLVMSNSLLAECNAAMKFSHDCPSLLFEDMAVKV